MLNHNIAEHGPPPDPQEELRSRLDFLFGQHISFVICLFLTVGLAALYCCWDVSIYIVIPLMVSDVFPITYAFAFKGAYSQRDSRCLFYDLLLDQICALSAKAMIELYISGIDFPISYAAIPLSLPIVFACVTRKFALSGVDTLITSIRLLHRIIRALVFLPVSLRLDGVLHWEWADIFSPIVMFSLISLFVSAFYFFLLIIKLVVNKQSFLSHAHFFWMIGFVLFTSAHLLYFIEELIRTLNTDLYTVTAPLITFAICLVLYIVATCLVKERVICWFLSEEVVDPIRYSLQVVEINSIYVKRKSLTFFEIQEGSDIENSSLELDDLDCKCTVCYENNSNAVFMECGHGGVCYTCAIEIYTTNYKCYLCRLLITSVLEIEHKEKLCYVVKTRTVKND